MICRPFIACKRSIGAQNIKFCDVFTVFCRGRHPRRPVKFAHKLLARTILQKAKNLQTVKIRRGSE